MKKRSTVGWRRQRGQQEVRRQRRPAATLLTCACGWCTPRPLAQVGREAWSKRWTPTVASTRKFQDGARSQIKAQRVPRSRSPQESIPPPVPPRLSLAHHHVSPFSPALPLAKEPGESCFLWRSLDAMAEASSAHPSTMADPHPSMVTHPVSVQSLYGEHHSGSHSDGGAETPLSSLTRVKHQSSRGQVFASQVPFLDVT